MENPEFKPEMRLVFQGSIPIATKEEGEKIYSDLKVFAKGFSLKTTVTGQLIEMLEPCCNKPAEKKL